MTRTQLEAAISLINLDPNYLGAFDNPQRLSRLILAWYKGQEKLKEQVK